MRARRHARVYRNGRAWSAGPSAVGGSKLRSVERDPCNDALQSSAISLSATGRAALYTRPKECQMKRLLIALASSSCADLPSRSLCPPVIPAHAQIAREDIPGAPLLAVVGHARKGIPAKRSNNGTVPHEKWKHLSYRSNERLIGDLVQTGTMLVAPARAQAARYTRRRRRQWQGPTIPATTSTPIRQWMN